MILILLLRLFRVPFVSTQNNVHNRPHTISATIAENTGNGNPSTQGLQSSQEPPVLALTKKISVEKYVDQNKLPLSNQINLFLQHGAYFEKVMLAANASKAV